MVCVGRGVCYHLNKGRVVQTSCADITILIGQEVRKMHTHLGGEIFLQRDWSFPAESTSSVV